MFFFLLPSSPARGRLRARADGGHPPRGAQRAVRAAGGEDRDDHGRGRVAAARAGGGQVARDGAHAHGAHVGRARGGRVGHGEPRRRRGRGRRRARGRRARGGDCGEEPGGGAGAEGGRECRYVFFISYFVPVGVQ